MTALATTNKLCASVVIFRCCFSFVLCICQLMQISHQLGYMCIFLSMRLHSMCFYGHMCIHRKAAEYVHFVDTLIGSSLYMSAHSVSA